MTKEIIKPQPKYYSIELEAMVPATLKYRILANSPEEALEGILKSQPIQQPKLIFPAMKSWLILQVAFLCLVAGFLRYLLQAIICIN